MPTFKEQMSSDAAGCMLSGEVSEAITYIPPSGAARRTIYAIIKRQETKPSPENAGRILIHQIEIVIPNNATYGLTSIQKGKDAFSFPENVGGSPIEWVIAKIISQDEGAWHLAVEK